MLKTLLRVFNIFLQRLTVVLDYPGNQMWHAYDQRVVHAESPTIVRHPCVGPPLGKGLELVKLVWNEPAPADALAPNDVLEAPIRYKLSPGRANPFLSKIARQNDAL